MSRSFQFFMSLDELKDAMTPIAEKSGASLWSFPEAAITGKVSRVAALEEGKRRMKWFGRTMFFVTDVVIDALARYNLYGWSPELLWDSDANE